MLLRSHPAVRELAALILRETNAYETREAALTHSVGLVELLWELEQLHGREGLLPDWTLKRIDYELCEMIYELFDRDEDMSALLVRVGLVEEVEGGLQLHWSPPLPAHPVAPMVFSDVYLTRKQL